MASRLTAVDQSVAATPWRVLPICADRFHQFSGRCSHRLSPKISLSDSNEERCDEITPCADAAGVHY